MFYVHICIAVWGCFCAFYSLALWFHWSDLKTSPVVAAMRWFVLAESVGLWVTATFAVWQLFEGYAWTVCVIGVRNAVLRLLIFTPSFFSTWHLHRTITREHVAATEIIRIAAIRLAFLEKSIEIRESERD